MRVFISWSGPRSHEIALALRDWLPIVLPGVEPWVSSEDIDKGARWTAELSRGLDASRFGVICLVPENIREPWPIFEAGAMARSIDTARVAPLLVGAAIEDVPGPLRQFQCTVFEMRDVRRLMASINRAIEAPVEGRLLDETFERLWPELEGRVLRTEVLQRPGDEDAGRAPVVEEVLPERAPTLHTQQVEILRLLARHDDIHPTLETVARTIRENQTRAQYHLDRLTAAGLVNYRFVRGIRSYLLTEGGRAYAVENDLDRDVH